MIPRQLAARRVIRFGSKKRTKITSPGKSEETFDDKNHPKISV